MDSAQDDTQILNKIKIDEDAESVEEHLPYIVIKPPEEDPNIFHRRQIVFVSLFT